MKQANDQTVIKQSKYLKPGIVTGMMLREKEGVKGGGGKRDGERERLVKKNLYSILLNFEKRPEMSINLVACLLYLLTLNIITTMMVMSTFSNLALAVSLQRSIRSANKSSRKCSLNAAKSLLAECCYVYCFHTQIRL